MVFCQDLTITDHGLCILFFSEALERLLYERFLEECNLPIPAVLLPKANRVNGDPSDIVDEIQGHADEYS